MPCIMMLLKWSIFIYSALKQLLENERTFVLLISVVIYNKTVGQVFVMNSSRFDINLFNITVINIITS